MNVTSITKLTLTFYACLACILLVAIPALNKGVLSPRALGILLTLLCVSAFLAFTIAFQKLARKASAATDQTVMPSVFEWVERHWMGVLVLSFWLSGAFWLTRGDPWIPRLVGAFFAVLFTIGWLSRKKPDATR